MVLRPTAHARGENPRNGSGVAVEPPRTAAATVLVSVFGANEWSCVSGGEGPPQVWRDTFVLMERTAALPAASEAPAEERAAAHAFAAGSQLVGGLQQRLPLPPRR